MTDSTRGRGLVLALAGTSVALAALAGVLIVKVARGDRPPRADDAERRASAAALEPGVETELRANIARLERRVSALAAETGAQQAATRGGEPAEPARAAALETPKRPVSLAEQREQGERALQAMYDGLDHRIETEAPDPAWRPETDVTAVLKSLPSPPRDVAVRCVASFCRVQLVSIPGADDLVQHIATQPPFAGGTTYRHDPDDPTRVTLYVQRPGHVLADDRP